LSQTIKPALEAIFPSGERTDASLCEASFSFNDPHFFWRHVAAACSYVLFHVQDGNGRSLLKTMISVPYLLAFSCLQNILLAGGFYQIEFPGNKNWYLTICKSKCIVQGVNRHCDVQQDSCLLIRPTQNSSPKVMLDDCNPWLLNSLTTLLF